MDDETEQGSDSDEDFDRNTKAQKHENAYDFSISCRNKKLLLSDRKTEASRQVDVDDGFIGLADRKIGAIKYKPEVAN